MSNKKLIQQYAQVSSEMPEYQYRKLSNNDKKTYNRQNVIKFKDGMSIIPHFVYRDLSDDDKQTVINKILWDEENYGPVSNNTLKSFVDEGRGTVFSEVVLKLLQNYKGTDGKDLFIINLLNVMTFYSEQIPNGAIIKIIKEMLKEPYLLYQAWGQITDALDGGEKISLTKIVREYVNNGGFIDASSLGALLKYNTKPMELFLLLGKERILKILNPEIGGEPMLMLSPKNWTRSAFNFDEVVKIKELLGI